MQRLPLRLLNSLFLRIQPLNIWAGSSTLFILLFYTLPLLGQNTTYYVALNGNDNADGLTPETAWQSVAHVNLNSFLPGDRILFRGGDSFTGTLYLEEDDGNDPENILEVSSFGDGRATIFGENSFGVVINDTEGIKIHNIELTGSGMELNAQSGIYLANLLENDFKLANIELRDLEISGFGVNGITVQSTFGNSGFRNVLIDNVKIHDCLDNGIVVIGDHDQNKFGYAHENIAVRNSEVYDIPGFDKEYHSGSGIMISDVQDSVIEDCVVYNCGYNNTQCGGPVGIWYFDANRVTIQHCEAYNMKSGTGCDGGGFDLDGGVTNAVMQYNYSHDNDGAGFLIGQYVDSRPMYNITVRYNISENDGRTNGSSIYLFNLNPTFPPERIKIYHNTVYVSTSETNPNLAAAGALASLPLGPDISFTNNLLFTSGDPALVSIPQDYPVDFINNLYYAEQAPLWNYQGVTYTTLENFRASGNELLEGAPVGFYGDPLLMNPGKGGTIGFGKNLETIPAYQLDYGSPALNVAIPVDGNDSPTDFFGNQAVLGPLADIGAFELDDDIPPVITLQGDDPYTQEAGIPFEDPGAETDDGSEVIVDATTLETGVGTYEVVYTSTDLYGNTSQTTRTVNVVDTRPPEIACEEIVVVLDPLGNAEVNEALIRANISDPSDFTVSFDNASYSCESIGEQTLAISATDAYGNTSNCNATVKVVDLIPPELFTSAEELPLEFYVAERADLEIPDFTTLLTVSDNCTPIDNITITQSYAPGLTLRSGNYDLEITLTDASGNTTTQLFPLTIIEGIPDDGPLFVYPNPVRSVVQYNKKVVRTTVYDLRGSRIYETFETRPDLSFLQSGIYVLEAVTGEGTFLKKVIKN